MHYEKTWYALPGVIYSVYPGMLLYPTCPVQQYPGYAYCWVSVRQCIASDKSIIEQCTRERQREDMVVGNENVPRASSRDRLPRGKEKNLYYWTRYYQALIASHQQPNFREKKRSLRKELRLNDVLLLLLIMCRWISRHADTQTSSGSWQQAVASKEGFGAT